MTEKEAIIVLQMVEAHGSLPIKAKAMAIEALRLADKANNIMQKIENSKLLDGLSDYVCAIGDYNSFVETINNQLADDYEKKKLYIKIFLDYEPSDVADRLYQMFDVPTLKKIAEKLLDYEVAEDDEESSD